jgi:hypothetical protein
MCLRQTLLEVGLKTAHEAATSPPDVAVCNKFRYAKNAEDAARILPKQGVIVVDAYASVVCQTSVPRRTILDRIPSLFP